MLYVFHVDMGRMLKFDMNVALSSVSNLKDTIERLHGIPAQNIVLLVSGGEMLTKSTQVSFYSAGTDTNPIYMFLMGDIKLTAIVPVLESEIDLKEQVDHCLTLPAVYDTVVTRAQLAQQMYDLAREEETLCERLVHEQHLQQQGWSAVVANMEDLTEEFRQRFINFCLSFDHHLEKRDEYIELLNSFADDLSKLSRIPILPGLMQMAQEDFHGFDAFLDNDDMFSRSQQTVSVILADGSQQILDQPTNTSNLIGSQDDDKRESTSPNKKLKMGSEDEKSNTNQSLTSIGNGTRDSRTRTLTLLQWISAKENHNKLKEMSEECIQSLNAFDDIVYTKLKEEVNNVIKSADQSDMKEVKGLSDRLCKLEEIKYKIKNMVQDQKELSTAFQQNQNRAINLRDPSILPDLCASHKSQLLVMLQNHQKIHDLRRCIAKAKDELGANLHTRLKRIVLLENKMSEFDNRQLFYHRCLKRAERHINIIEQIHQAPCIYVAAVTEVVRRKIFSGEFRQWASKLAEDFDSIHSEEINRRRKFNASFEGHFLNILFPGMNDMPPAFANENPLVFDTRLPNITERDIDVLTTYLPDLTHHIQLPDMGPVINFFISRSGNQNINEKNSTSDKTVLNSTVCPINVHHQRVLDLQSQFKDGCDESETDTEEFEKVIQPEMSPTVNTSGSTSENVYQVAHMGTSTEQPQTNTVETLTEECSHSDERNEFINSEFYLDESIPSIYGGDDKCHNSRNLELCNSLKGKLKSVLEVRPINVMSSTYPSQTIRSNNNMIINFDTKESMETMFSLLQENLGTTRLEVERLRSVLKAMSQVSTECINLARANFQKITYEHKNFQLDFRSEFQNISEKWQLVQMQYESRERDIQEMTSKYTQDTLCLKADIKLKDEKIRNLENDLQQKGVHWNTKVSQLEANYADLKQRYQQLEKQFDIINYNLKEANADKMRALAELQDNLTHKHKTEIESLRCRYKLMTSMERSPSDTSLERIEKPVDMVELGFHESNIIQMRKALIAEKEEAIKEAVNYERSFWEAKMRCKCLTECSEHNATVNSYDETQNSLKQEIQNLNREKYRIEEQLNVEKSKRAEMEQSFADLKGSIMEASTLRRSKSSGSNHRYIVLETCSKGDIVFVVWNARHCQFMVVQDSQCLYFVHCDSLSALNLKIPGSGEPDVPSPFFALGRVIHKEFCQARKHENRYRVCRGTRFYRIKLEPLSRAEPKCASRRERVESTSSSASINRSPSQNEPCEQSLSNINVSRQSQRDVDLGCINSGLKERTTSVTSVTEEDDEPISLLSDRDRCRYISVSEEEEPNRSVITEQPTSSYFVSMDNASASSSMTSSTPVNVATSTVITVSRSPKPIQILANIGNCSLEKDTDDSDEYRSLEAKDENEFPIAQE